VAQIEFHFKTREEIILLSIQGPGPISALEEVGLSGKTELQECIDFCEGHPFNTLLAGLCKFGKKYDFKLITADLKQKGSDHLNPVTPLFASGFHKNEHGIFTRNTDIDSGKIRNVIRPAVSAIVGQADYAATFKD